MVVDVLVQYLQCCPGKFMDFHDVKPCKMWRKRSRNYHFCVNAARVVTWIQSASDAWPPQGFLSLEWLNEWRDLHIGLDGLQLQSYFDQESFPSLAKWTWTPCLFEASRLRIVVFHDGSRAHWVYCSQAHWFGNAVQNGQLDAWQGSISLGHTLEL